MHTAFSTTGNLFRIVAECTQPYGPPASGPAARSLQTYLADAHCVDSVYRAILARACAEPQSDAVIAKCISLIRQYVSRYPPSAPVLEAIAAACNHLGASLPHHAALQKSLAYLESSVMRIADSTSARKRLAKLSSRYGSSNASSKGVWLHGAANGDLAASSSSSKAAAAGGSTHSLHSSASEEVLGGLSGNLQQGKAGNVSVRGSAEQQQQQHQLQQQYIREDASEHAGGMTEGDLALEQQHARLVTAEAVLPQWTFQPSALQELWGDAADDAIGLDWSVLLPQLSPSLVPLVEGLPGIEAVTMLSCQDIIDAISDADVPTQLRQMREITEVRRLQGGVTPELMQQAMQQALSNRARRLFQPLPYTQHEQADVLSSDVAAVVEIMCGKPNPAAPSAITGTVGLEDPATYWQQQCVGSASQPLLLLYQQTSSIGGPQQQQRHSESIGQISSCILVKLVVDLWLSVGGAVAFPLVLRMLQQSLYQLQPQYRARAFDIIYNLALHGCMLMPATPSPPPSPQARPGRQYGAQAAASSYGLISLQQQQPDVVALVGPGSATREARQSPAGSARSQDEPTGAQSSPSSPKGHVAAVQQQQQQQPGVVSPLGLASVQTAAVGAGPVGSGSPQPSPRGRSRLSRSERSWNAPDTAAAAASVSSSQPQQQQQQPGLSSSAAVLAGAVPDAAADGIVQGQGSGSGCAGDSDRMLQGVQEEPMSVEAEWESWLQQLLFELLLMLAMVNEPCEAVWQAALGCLLHLTTHGGHWVAASLSQLPTAAAAALLDACVTFNWSQELHARLVQMAVNLLYVTDQEPPAANAQQGAATGAYQQPPLQQQLRGSHNSSPCTPEATGSSMGPLSPADVSVSVAADVPSSNNSSPRRQHRTATAAGRAGDIAELAATAPSVQQGFEERHSQLADFDLPCQLHAGPVDEQQLAAFGGPEKLLKHFCHAASIEAQRTLLVPLLQVLMPADAPDTAQLAVLQVLCASPSCLAALQTTLSAGLAGWPGLVLSAVTQQLGDEGLDLQLMPPVLHKLEQLAVQRTAVCSSPLQQQQQQQQGWQVQQQAPQQEPLQQQQQPPEPLLLLPPEVQVAMHVTLQQLRGQLPSQPQLRHGLQGTEEAVYQVAAEVQGCWRALKALCWCDDDMARRASRHWLQQLLALTLQQSLKKAILLPLPGVKQRTPAHTDAAAAAASIASACEAWVDVLSQLVAHCPGGADLLVDALQLHITSCKLQLHQAQQQQQAGNDAAAAPAAAGIVQQQWQKQRQAIVAECVQAWAFVCQWVMQARMANSQAALACLAAMAHSLACILDVPDWHGVAAAGTAAEEAAEAAGSGAVVATVADASASAMEPAEAAHPVQQHAAGAAVEGSCDPASPIDEEPSRDFDGSGCRGEVPPLEPSSEPSALASMWARGGSSRAPGAAVTPEPASAAAAAAAAMAAAEGVCWPQAFLLGRALLVQQMAQVLSGASLALLLVRLLQCKPLSRAADRGFHGRPTSRAGGGSISRSSHGLCDVLPCPVLYPWSDGRQDLQLGLVLMLISSCSSDAESFAVLGLEAVTQQVLSGCTDPRACLVVSQFMLEHLMRHQQDHYWAALRQLVTAAQQANDERLLGNPFLQLITLLSQQQQQRQQPMQGPSKAGPEAGVPTGQQQGRREQHTGGIGLGLGMGWSSKLPARQ